MALRIIRKTGQQSHIEVIRGTGSGDGALLSLLLYIRRETDLEAFRQWLDQADDWLKASSEMVVVKSSRVATPLRTLFAALPQSIKLLPESEDGGAARRLRSLLQEAASEICLYLSCAPLPRQDGWMRQVYEKLRQERNTGAAGPVLTHRGRIVSAGLARSGRIGSHTLPGPEGPVSLAAAPVTAAFAGLKPDIFANRQDPLPVAALPLCGQALRRPLLQDFDWNESLAGEGEMGLALGAYLHQRQYWVSLLPVTAPLAFPPEPQEQWQTPPAWQTDQGPLLSDLSSLYGRLGFQPGPDQPSAFVHAAGTPDEEARIAAYLAASGQTP